MELKFYYRPHHSKTSWWKALQFIRQQWLLDVLGIVCVEQRPSVKGWCVVFGSICGKRLHFHDSHSWTLTVAQRALAKFHAALRPYPRIYQKVNNSRKLKKFCSQKDKVYCCYRGNGFINMIFFTVLAVNFYVFFFFFRFPFLPGTDFYRSFWNQRPSRLKLKKSWVRSFSDGRCDAHLLEVCIKGKWSAAENAPQWEHTLEGQKCTGAGFGTGPKCL